jgi:hypothetical protein
LFPAFSDDPFLSIQVLIVSNLLNLGHANIPAVVSVTAVDDTGLPVDPDLLVESLVMHIHVEVGTSLSSQYDGPVIDMIEVTHIVLPELDTSRMSLDNLLDQIGNTRLVLESTRMVPFDPAVILRESTLDGIL